MKALIWIVCCFAFALIQALVKETGIILGGIPTGLLAFLTVWGARRICKQWDLHRVTKKAKEKGLSVIEYAKKSTKEEVLRKCETINDNKELKSYLKQQSEYGEITDHHVAILYDHYKK